MNKGPAPFGPIPCNSLCLHDFGVPPGLVRSDIARPVQGGQEQVLPDSSPCTNLKLYDKLRHQSGR